MERRWQHRISELEGRSVILIQCEQKRVDWKQMNRVSGTETIIKSEMFIALESQKERRKGGAERVFKKGGWEFLKPGKKT